MRKRDIQRKANDIILHVREVEEAFNSCKIPDQKNTLELIGCELSAIKKIALEIRDE